MSLKCNLCESGDMELHVIGEKPSGELFEVPNDQEHVALQQELISRNVATAVYICPECPNIQLEYIGHKDPIRLLFFLQNGVNVNGSTDTN